MLLRRIRAATSHWRPMSGWIARQHQPNHHTESFRAASSVMLQGTTPTSRRTVVHTGRAWRCDEYVALTLTDARQFTHTLYGDCWPSSCKRLRDARHQPSRLSVHMNTCLPGLALKFQQSSAGLSCLPSSTPRSWTRQAWKALKPVGTSTGYGLHSKCHGEIFLLQ